ncbi:haloacid dehalogenase [Pyrenochaeta sp. DS3sAY3a]|nr:haloacid dehalogenase [Pyrenochaeta sp. DS3sAY3a]
MSAAKAAGTKRNLLLCFDAFGTLFTPGVPVPVAYAKAAARHGIDCGDAIHAKAVAASFKAAFKQESKARPNYGKAAGLGAEKWWGNVIRSTFKDFLKPGQQVPQALVSELLNRYSTGEGYDLYGDVIPFFKMLRQGSSREHGDAAWPWENTVVGIVTNSDDRVPGILESFGLKIGPRRIGTSDQRRAEAALEDDISFVVLSYDVGFEKPDRRMFDSAVDMLRENLAGNVEDLTVDSFEKLYVGDEVEKDYEGARAAGWDSVLLDRDVSEVNDQLGEIEVLGKKGESRNVLRTTSLHALKLWRPSGI